MGFVGGVARTAAGIVLARAVWAGCTRLIPAGMAATGAAWGFGINPIEALQAAGSGVAGYASRVLEALRTADPVETYNAVLAHPSAAWWTAGAIALAVLGCRSWGWKLVWSAISILTVTAFVNL